MARVDYVLPRMSSVCEHIYIKEILRTESKEEDGPEEAHSGYNTTDIERNIHWVEYCEKCGLIKNRWTETEYDHRFR